MNTEPMIRNDASPNSRDSAQADFIQLQIAFAAHLRDPARVAAPPDIEDRRMAIYRDLVFNNIESLLAGNFPVLRSILSDDHWQALIRGFLVRHRAKTPHFPELPQEFLAFLSTSRPEDPPDPPFILELAHYEWVELALRISDAAPDRHRLDPEGDLLESCPMISPLAWNLSYRFPVHRIGPGHQPETPAPEPTHLLVYRTPDERIEFLEINAVTQRLLVLIQEDPTRSGREILRQIANELMHPEPDQLIAFGSQLLNDLRRKGVLLGTWLH